MTATLYSANDASAPALGTTNDGSLYNIMKAVLIDGYGTRTPVGGWTIAFDNASNKIVFKHATESIYYRVDDSLDYRFAEARGYATMSDIDTGTGPFPDDVNLANKHLVGKRYTTAADQNLWHMLVHDGGDWFYFWTGNVSYPTGFFFGKIDTPDTPTFSRWFITGYDGTTISSSNFPKTVWQEINYTHYMQNHRFNLGGAEKCTWQHAEESMGQPSPIDGKLYFTKEYIRSAVSPYIYYGTFPNRIRGWGSFSGLMVTHQKVSFGGKNYITLMHGASCYLLEYDADS